MIFEFGKNDNRMQNARKTLLEASFYSHFCVH